MMTRISWKISHTPSTTEEVVTYLRESACVDDRGMRRLPNWMDDGVFDNAADLIDTLRNALEELLPAAEQVLAGLQARIDAADKRSVPVFSGIVDLSDAIHVARAALTPAA